MSPESLISNLALVWASLTELGDGLSGPDWERPTDCPGWSVRDQYAHMIGTESTLLGEPAPPPYPAPHARNPMGEANEGWVEAVRDRPGPEVLAAFRAVTDRRLAALRALPAEAWEAATATPVGPGTYATFMEIRVFDCWVHEQDVRRAVGRPGHLDGTVAELAMGRVTGSLGFVVGKRASAPDGTSVVVALGDPLARTLAVQVAGGRAASVDPPAAPTVRIRTDGETWMRLSTGREDGAHAMADRRVAFDGDADLGRAIVAQLAITP